MRKTIIVHLAICLSLINIQCTSPSKEQGATSFPWAGRGVAGLTLDKSGYAYDPNDRSCDGFPRLRVQTMPGTCLGLVVSRERGVDTQAGKSFIMPRTIVQIPNTDARPEFLLADMGGWKANNGTLFWLRPGPNGRYEVKAVKSGLNTPHGLAMAPDGYFYLGESQQILRFKFSGGKLSDTQVVVAELPRFKGHMHPLTQITFNPANGDMFINSGAPSDHCFVKETGSYALCPEEFSQGLGAIYRVPAAALKNLGKNGIQNYETSASGLRNSMAMVVHPTGTLIQGENGRDFSELDEPYEEINVVEPNEEGDYRGFHHGWPYCYDFHAVSPEWKHTENADTKVAKAFRKPVDCKLTQAREAGQYQMPHSLMPPHVAPLHIAYYQGKMFNDLLGRKMLMSWHGYQPTGHRLVAYDVDAKGRPVLASSAAKATYSFDQKRGCPIQKPYKPTGGFDRHAPYTEVISHWSEVKGERPKGAPVSFTTASDGSIWIVEDRENRTVLRLARTTNDAAGENSCGSTASVKPDTTQEDPRIELLAWRNHLREDEADRSGYEKVQTNLIGKYCVGCHGNMQSTDVLRDQFSRMDFLMAADKWVVPGHPTESKMYQAITQSGEVPPMPPGGSKQFHGTPEGDAIVSEVRSWIQGLPGDIPNRYKRTLIKKKRNIRNRPQSQGGIVCGAIPEGEAVYIDPRPETIIRTGELSWVKTYFLPMDSRLFKSKCEYPADGVFYVAL